MRIYLQLFVQYCIQEKDYNAKISDIEATHFTTFCYIKFTSEVLETKIKEKELIGKSHISNLVENLASPI